MSATRMNIRLLLPCPPRTAKRAWGDWYFGHSLGAALERLGCSVRYSYRRDNVLTRALTRLARQVRRNEVELVIRGKRVWSSIPGKPCLAWIISQSDSVMADELRDYAHVFVASPDFLRRIAGDCASASLLYQCTDAGRFFPPGADGPRSRILFVGNRRDYAPRDIVLKAIAEGHDIEVWGRGWEDVLSEDHYSGLHVENAELAGLYGRATAVLNDHTEEMRRDGFVSNRVYDVLACGTPLVTERMSGLPEGFPEALFLYGDETEFLARLAELPTVAAPMTGRLRAFAAHVRAEHSFDARARDIFAVIAKLSGQSAPLRPGVAAP